MVRQMKLKTDVILKPMVIGGVIGGILSSIPIINCLNCCCLLYMASGAIAIYLIPREAKSIDLEDGALVGAGSGAIAGLVDGVLGTIIDLTVGKAINASMMAMMGMPPSMQQQMMAEHFMNSSLAILSILIAIVLGAIFGTIGAIIYIKINEKS